MIEQLFLSAAPLLILTIGLALTEYARVLNIGAEGLAGFGAFFFAVLTVSGLPLPLALPAAGLVSVLAAGLLAFLHLRLGANIFLAGLGINLLAWGGLSVVSRLLFDHSGIIPMNRSLAAQGIPIESLPDIVLFVALLLALAFVAAALFLRFSPAGIRLRMLAEHQDGLDQVGSSPRKLQWGTLLFSGFLCGIAGAFIALRVGTYVPNLSAGRGWVALAIVFLARRNSAAAAGLALVYALGEAVSIATQANLELPGQVLGLPYVFLLGTVIIWLGARKLAGRLRASRQRSK